MRVKKKTELAVQGCGFSLSCEFVDKSRVKLRIVIQKIIFRAGVCPFHLSSYQAYRSDYFKQRCSHDFEMTGDRLFKGALKLLGPLRLSVGGPGEEPMKPLKQESTGPLCDHGAPGASCGPYSKK